MMNADAVSIRDLVKTYPVSAPGLRGILSVHSKARTTALNGLDLSVKAGTCFCLLGPNGAGKTTLIKILTTLVLPDSGRADVFGLDVVRRPNEVKRYIGCLFGDERSFHWRLTGRQNLEFFGALDGLSGRRLAARIDRLLELTSLADKADRAFSSYSAGMKQMLAMARALISDPDLLLVDEPTRSLDPLAAAAMRDFLKRDMVGRMGKTVFLATHDLAEAGEMADELAVIDRGRITASGTPAALTGNGARSLREVFKDAVLRHGPDGEE